MDEYNYAALAKTKTIENITSDERNQDILRRLKDNDPSLNRLRICNYVGDESDSCYYISSNDDDDVGWLGYYIGQNTSLQELYFAAISFHKIYDVNFYKGLNHNKSIQEIDFEYCDLWNGQIFGMFDQLFKNNHNLTEIRVMDCQFGMENARQLSLALGDCLHL